MPVFARRAAPVQATFIGYPDTTGLKAMDFRLTDAIADPPGAERYCTERLVRLPGCFLCYQPPANAPEVAPSPWRQNGFVTFGSFNNLAKVSEDVIARWAHILREVPDARLIIKNPSLTDVATRERYQALFAQAGVAAGRLALLGYVKDDAGHLGTYRLVDIALDTFPYNGTTTTCEALWMGVPVVSLRGDRHSARVGASLLTAAGFPDWIADTPEHYLQLAGGLAGDRTRLAELRSQLRERVRQSRLCSAENYARAVEHAYEGMLAVRHNTAV
jgi:predicted O-linked N-acetylglucosamine transferase (SPINDLY family)